MEFVIIDKKEWNEAKGCYPYRIVLTAKIDECKTKHQENANKYAIEYTTHQQINGTRDNNKIYLASGHYFQKLGDAIKDFKERF